MLGIFFVTSRETIAPDVTSPEHQDQVILPPMLRNLSLKLVFHVVLVCHGGLKAKEAILDHVTRGACSCGVDCGLAEGCGVRQEQSLQLWCWC